MSNHLAIVPPPPREPGVLARRTILKSPPDDRALLWFGLGWLVLCMPFALLFLWGRPIDLVLEVASSRVPGYVTRVSSDSSVRENGVSPLVLRFSYEVDGQSYTEESYAHPDGPLDEVQAGSKVTVETFRPHPTWSRIEGARRAMFGPSAMMVMMFPLFGFGVMAMMPINRIRRRHVYERGVSVVGHIDSIDVREIAWRYAVDGTAYVQRLALPTDSPLRTLTEGAAVMVLYLPTDPHRSVLFVSDNGV